jgi:hypothetical protein
MKDFFTVPSVPFYETKDNYHYDDINIHSKSISFSYVKEYQEFYYFEGDSNSQFIERLTDAFRKEYCMIWEE